MEGKKLKVVEWLDAVCQSHWCGPGQPLEPIKAVSIGWVLHEDDVYIQLAGTIATDGEYNQCMTIPAPMIQNIREITVAPKPCSRSVKRLTARTRKSAR
jgi:hypothetical protein